MLVAIGRRRHYPEIAVLELLQCVLNIVGLIDPERPLRSISSLSPTASSALVVTSRRCYFQADSGNVFVAFGILRISEVM